MKQLIKFAKADLKIAKKNGVVLVCDTKIGNIEIKLIHGSLYQFTNFNTGEQINAAYALTAKEASEKLASLYQVA